MAYTTIDKPTDYFEAEIYSGSSSDVTLNSLDFQPDWVWLKKTSSSGDHLTYDSVRGTNKRLTINGTDAEVDRSSNNDELKSFNSDGWTLGTFNSNVTGSGSTCISYNWKASGSTASNTDGDITSTVSVNTTAGFSIVSWTGNGTAGQTIGHGLGSVPNIIITKGRSSALNWFLFDSMSSYLKRLKLNTNDSQADTDGLNDTAPTSSVFTVSGGGEGNTSGVTYIGYLFAEKKGYSKFGTYTGNGNADGPFIHTGFKPAFIIIKKTSANEDWELFDNKRLGFNVDNNNVVINSSSAQATTDRLDIVSNGIKFRTSSGSANSSGATYLYMALAESPFVTSTGIPTTAR